MLVFFRATVAVCLGVLLPVCVADPIPEPGKVPKVYNALITSNQNLEPSKAYPVYQPVIHDAFSYPFPQLYYPGDFPSIYQHPLQPQRPQYQPPQQPPHQFPQQPQPPSPPPSDSSSEDKSPPQEAPQPPEQPDKNSDSSPTQPPPAPPKTESPIPLNQFGLPPRVLPLGRVGPPYESFMPVSPFSYSYPGFRFYDPYDPFPVSPYLHVPQIYRPFPNFVGQNPAVAPNGPKPEGRSSPDEIKPSSPAPSNVDNDDSILNYPSKDPSIPNVPPPPLTEGGAASSDEKSD